MTQAREREQVQTICLMSLHLWPLVSQAARSFKRPLDDTEGAVISFSYSAATMNEPPQDLGPDH